MDRKEVGIERFFNPILLSNILTSLDLLSFLPLLELWSFEFIEDSQKETDKQGKEHYCTNAFFRYDPRVRKPSIVFNRLWAEEELTSGEEVITILLHECLHFLLGYYGGCDPYLTEAWECFINQTIAVIVKGNPAYLGVVRRTFKDQPYPTNFRCDQGSPKGYIQGRLYQCLYDYENPGVIPEIIEEDDVYIDVDLGTQRVYNSNTGTHNNLQQKYDNVPLPICLIDPYTLAEFFASEDKDPKPRTPEEHMKALAQQVQKALSGEAKGEGEEGEEGESSPGEAGANGGTPSDLVLSEGAGLPSQDLGRNVMGKGEDLPPDQILPPEVAASMLETLSKEIAQDIWNSARDDIYSTSPTEAEKRYTKRIPAATQREIAKGYYRPYRTLLGEIATGNADNPILNLEKTGMMGGGGGVPILVQARERTKIFLTKSKLRQDLERVAQLDEQGKVNCFFRGKVKKAPSRSARPSFQRDRLASALVTQGRAPATYRRKEPENPQGLVWVLMDVSGSVADLVQKFMEFLNPIRDLCYQRVVCFSGFTYEEDWDKLLKTGLYRTDNGNDFDSQIDWIREHKLRHICFLTDGYFSCTQENFEWAKSAHLEIVSIHPGQWMEGCQLEQLSSLVVGIDEYIKGQPK